MKKVYRWFAVLVLLTVSLYAEVATYENVTRLYIATFDRVPDRDGLDYWVEHSGFSLEEVAMSFFDQPETQLKYPPGTPTEEFVESVYLNLFDRLPDEAGQAYWVSEIESGRVHESVYILAVINGAQGDDAAILAQKTEDALVQLGIGVSYGKEIEDAVQRNNEIRAEVYSGSLLVWSQTLASSAQEYADILAVSGAFEHSGWGYGENIFASSYSSVYLDAINAWYGEKENYNYADNSCIPGEQCGHYTQLIWKSTERFGCGKAVYQTGTYEGWTVIVCQYDPPGNYIGQRPY